jgi:hypothetical protein
MGARSREAESSHKLQTSATSDPNCQPQRDRLVVPHRPGDLRQKDPCRHERENLLLVAEVSPPSLRPWALGITGPMPWLIKT